MNSIEQMFYDAWDREPNEESENLKPQSVVGIYRVDFLIGKIAIEIDGHDFHKTKEQREHDYNKDRYLIRNGYTPVRFTGTEVFLDSAKCVEEARAIRLAIDETNIDNWTAGEKSGRYSMVRELKEYLEDLNGQQKVLLFKT